jgi:hypothetical protein
MSPKQAGQWGSLTSTLYRQAKTANSHTWGHSLKASYDTWGHVLRCEPAATFCVCLAATSGLML